MKIKGAGNHCDWEVNIGYYYQDAARFSPTWLDAGFGCLVHPRIVLTTLSSWKKAENDRRRQGHVMVRIGSKKYTCQLVYEEEDHDSAALVLAEPASDLSDKPFETFPEIASDFPEPGQTLGVFVDQVLRDEFGRNVANYLCYTFGTVSLLRGKDELLYGLSGLEWQEKRLYGKAVFDPAGKLYGITKQYLKCNFETIPGISAQTGYLVFFPFAIRLRQAAEETIRLLK